MHHKLKYPRTVYIENIHVIKKEYIFLKTGDIITKETEFQDPSGKWSSINDNETTSSLIGKKYIKGFLSPMRNLK